MPKWRPISINRFFEDSGVLSVIEHPATLPFVVERVFWLTDVALNATRGGHAHEDLQQVLFCAKGSCNIELIDQAGKAECIGLSQQSEGLYLEGNVWRTMTEFSADCCLMVLCDRPYKDDKVIRSFDEFMAQV
jgi:dTDP-4-dehydrorhamnose 3,5-epimerase-like enzyme